MHVLVTGGGGFIASHVVKQLLEEGHTVRTSVRSMEAKRTAHLRGPNVLGVEGATVELVQLELTEPAGWEDAVEGCDAVIHTASPVPHMPHYYTDPTLTDQAVQGTLHCLQAAAGRVSRVVMTSSIAAVAFTRGRLNDLQASGPALTEADWSQIPDNPMKMGSYHASKTAAERAAWDFVANLPAETPLELAVINPSIVIGPTLQGRINASNDMIYRSMSGQVPAFPAAPVVLPTVDVREVAAAHIAALNQPEAAGERFILHGEISDLADVILGLKSDPACRGLRMPSRFRVPLWMLRVAAQFSSEVRDLFRSWDPNGTMRAIDGSKAQRILGIRYRPARDSIVDVVRHWRTDGTLPPL